MSYAITVRVLKFQPKHDFCLADLHNRFELTNYQFQRKFQQLIVSLEASINLNYSFINPETLFSVFTGLSVVCL